MTSTSTLPTEVAGEFREFLDSHPLEISSDQHIFGFEHQSVLRIAALIEGDGADLESLVFRYWESKRERDQIKVSCRQRLHDMVPAAKPSGAALMADTRTSWSHYASRAARPKKNGILRIESDYGIAEYPVLERRYDSAEARVDVVRGPYFSSLGMLMFYGFGAAPGYAVLQPVPINLLAFTAKYVAQHGLPSETRCGWPEQRLREACERANAKGRITEAAAEMLMFHELGHMYCVPTPAAPDDTLTMLANATGHHSSDLLTWEFPTADKRKSWSRLVQENRVEDAFYMLGDLLANCRALEYGLAEDAWAIMQAFNWRFVLENESLRRPRGNAVILVDQDQADALARSADFLFRVAQDAQRGASLTASLSDLESEAWQLLKPA